MKSKKKLRHEIQILFRQYSREFLQAKDQVILQKVIHHIDSTGVQNICIYESMQDEVDTTHIIHFLEKAGINIFIPQVISETDMMLVSHDEYEIYNENIDMFIIPARAFTLKGERLGRGKGYYDRFLCHKKYTNSQKLGICYDFQVLDNIPIDTHDIQMDYIIF